jgi:hypothetical protein
MLSLEVSVFQPFVSRCGGGGSSDHDDEEEDQEELEDENCGREERTPSPKRC